jgi:predicted MPP superfamily phosphohydrolase
LVQVILMGSMPSGRAEQFPFASFPTTRRQFFLRAAAVGTLALAGDSLLLEPNRPRIVRRDFFLTRWPQALNGFTIALLSDFHYDRYFSVHPLHATVPLVNGLQPDLIVLTETLYLCPGSEMRRKQLLRPNLVPSFCAK